MTRSAGRMGGTVHRTTINFSDSLWKAINRERGDTSASAYVREAALMRIFYERGAKNDADCADALRMAKDYLRDEG